MNNESPNSNTRFESLKSSLVISRIVYRKASAIEGGIMLLAIVLAIKGAFWIADWGDAVFGLLLIGLYLHTLTIQKLLVGIWGKDILTVDQHVATVMLRKMQGNLIQRGW